MTAASARARALSAGAWLPASCVCRQPRCAPSLSLLSIQHFVPAQRVRVAAAAHALFYSVCARACVFVCACIFQHPAIAQFSVVPSSCIACRQGLALPLAPKNAADRFQLTDRPATIDRHCTTILYGLKNSIVCLSIVPQEHAHCTHFFDIDNPLRFLTSEFADVGFGSERGRSRQCSSSSVDIATFSGGDGFDTA